MGWKATHAEDGGKLDYAPPEDEQRIWRGISYLHGVEMPNETGGYLHSAEDIQEAYERIRVGQA